MEEKKNTLFAKMEEFGKRNRSIIWLLSICLIITSLPNPYYRTFAQAAGMPDDGGQYEILSVSELPEDVKSQTVDVGTRIESLDLPDSLTVSYCQVDAFLEADTSIGLPTSAVPKTPVESQKPEAAIPGTVQSEETGLEPGHAEEAESGQPGGTGSEADKAGQISEAVMEGITWESAPEYDAEKEGTYIFLPVFPRRYQLAENFIVPKIVVNVESGEDKTTSDRREDTDFIDEEELLFIEEEHILFADEGKESEVIRIPAGQIEVWGARTLSEGTIIVEEGAVLTITGCMTISGSVTITGGGTIRRGAIEAYFHVPSDGNLTLGNVTVDGNAITANYSMIRNSGSLTLDDGCVIQRCASTGEGGALSQNTGKAVLKKAVIQNCASAGSGGAIYIRSGIVEIDSTVFDGCEANAGGAIYTESVINIRDAVIENCVAKARGGAIAAHQGSMVNLYSGIYRNNCTTNTSDAYSYAGGGCIYSCRGTFNIYGGSFLDNSAANKGGCINHCAHQNTFTNIYGGIFQGNSCSFPEYEGSGGIFNSSVENSFAELTVSGNVKFGGDETEGSGVSICGCLRGICNRRRQRWVYFSS